MARPRTVEAERIRAAAAALLAERGRETLTVEAIARTAGVSPGTIYNYFRNKEHLLAAARDVPGARSAWCDAPPGQPPGEYLEQLAATALARFRLIGAAARKPAQAAPALGRDLEPLVPLLADYLAGLGAASEPEATARAFFAAACGTVVLGWDPARDASLASALASMVSSQLPRGSAPVADWDPSPG